MLKIILHVLFLSVLSVQWVHAQVDQWEPVNNGLEDLKVLALAVDADGRIFAGTDTGRIFRSVDSGENWEDVTHNVNLFKVSRLAAAPDGTLYTAYEYPRDEGLMTYVYRSVDHGDTWTPFVDGLPEQIDRLQCLEVSPDGTLYVGVGNTEWDTTGLYRLNSSTNRMELFNVFPGGITVTMEFDGPDVIYLGEGIILDGNGVDVSKDGGQTFHRLGNFPHLGLPVSAMHVDKDGYFYAASMGSYPYRLDWSWVELSNGLPDDGWPEEPSNSGYTVVAIESRPDPFGDMFIATDRYGVFRTVRHGAIWEDVNQGLTNLNATELVCDSEGTLFVATDGGGVFRSTPTVPVELAMFQVE